MGKKKNNATAEIEIADLLNEIKTSPIKATQKTIETLNNKSDNNAIEQSETTTTNDEQNNENISIAETANNTGTVVVNEDRAKNEGANSEISKNTEKDSNNELISTGKVQPINSKGSESSINSDNLQPNQVKASNNLDMNRAIEKRNQKIRYLNDTNNHLVEKNARLRKELETRNKVIERRNQKIDDLNRRIKELQKTNSELNKTLKKVEKNKSLLLNKIRILEANSKYSKSSTKKKLNFWELPLMNELKEILMLIRR